MCIRDRTQTIRNHLKARSLLTLLLHNTSVDSGKMPVTDLKSSGMIILKGWLFLLIAIISFTLLALQFTNWEMVALLAICIWSACRFYYFAFYVIQHYVDDSYRFAGLIDFIRYWLPRRSRKEKD